MSNWLAHLSWSHAALVAIAFMALLLGVTTLIGKFMAGPPENLPNPHHSAVRNSVEAVP